MVALGLGFLRSLSLLPRFLNEPIGFGSVQDCALRSAA
jgi:hypothetical protein